MSKPAPGAERVGDALQCTPDTYRRVFESNPDGQIVLQALCRKFYRDPYVKGGVEGERDTLVRVGENRVMIYILTQIGRTTEVTDDAAQE